jgi:hypothetical protein
VKDYTYHGTVLTDKNELIAENENIFINVIRAYYTLLPVLKSQSVLRAEKIEVNKTFIRPVTSYGAESWT